MTDSTDAGGALPPADVPPAPSDAPAPSDELQAPQEPQLPDYKGAPLDPERGPGLGCFWAQVVLLVLLLVLTPISVWLAAPSWLSAALLILILVLLFFVGQTMIFLLRLVAADRRTRRRPMAPNAKPTVGQMEDASSATPEAGPEAAAGQEPPEPGSSDQDDTTPDEPLT